MTYTEVVEDLVKLVEAIGAAIMVLGGLWTLVAYARAAAHPDRRAGAYQQARRSLGRVILLGLEVLIIADIIRTIVVDPTVEGVLVLGLIVVIRIVLSFSLEVEIDGAWPWQRWRLAAATAADPVAPGAPPATRPDGPSERPSGPPPGASADVADPGSASAPGEPPR